MQEKTKKRDLYLSAGLTIVLLIFVGLFFDYYYELNDDVWVQEILSGRYTGAPSAHAVQLHYLLGLLLSAVYCVFGRLPVFGLFLLGMQYFCIAVFVYEVLQVAKCSSAIKNVLAGLLALLAIYGLFGSHLVEITYTVTAALLGATACFVAICHQQTRAKAILIITFVVVGYNLRSEMMLLLLPLLICCLIYSYISAADIIYTRMSRAGNGGKNLSKEERKNIILYYVRIVIVMFTLLLVSEGINRISNSSEEWTKYVSFFDDRTTVYDFTGIPDYGSNSEAFEQMGFDRSEYELLINYDFGLDEKIDSAFMKRLVELSPKYKGSVATIKHYMLHSQPARYAIPVILLYILATIFICIDKTGDYKVKLLGIIFGPGMILVLRMMLWSFILYRGRYPDRITHSLYIAEIFILLGMLLWQMQKVKTKGAWQIVLVVFILCTVMELVVGTRQTLYVNEKEAKNAQNYKVLTDYCNSRPDNFYFWDVYSTVGFVRPVLELGNPVSNYDIMGGWLNKSPLTEEKMNLFGISSMESGLLQDGVYMIYNPKETLDWLYAYYEGKGYSIEISNIETINEDFCVLKLDRIYR